MMKDLLSEQEQGQTVFQIPQITGPSLLSSSIHYIALLSILLLLPLIYLVPKIRRDYYAFLALGPGGTPSTPAGYVKVSILQLFALRNPLKPPLITPSLDPQMGILNLKELPRRRGSRPKVVGLAPQRQLSQMGSPEIFRALSGEITALAHAYPDRLFLGTSCFEKHSTGLFSITQLQNRVTCNGEICHAHPSDGSLHLTLHPADVKRIIDKGWGERHPLARENWWWRLKFVPSCFVLIYAPRDAEELAWVVDIIRASVWWVGGRELKG